VGPAAPVLGACASVPAADGACVRSVERPIGGGAEWWARSTAGLHHGFRVDTRLPGAGPLWLDIAFDGASDLELTSGGDGVSFVDAGGEPWSWAGLRAWDDRGLPVAATLELRAGGVRVHLDDADARYPLHVDPLLTTAWATRTGGAVSNFFGAALSGVGDLNGDGYGDLAVGAPGFSADTGRVFVFYGAATGIAATPDLTITGSNTGIRLGEAVAAAGDVNDDGYADLLVGAPEFSGARGRAYVHYGGPSGISATPDVTLTGSTTSIRLGASVAGPGDVNGDGVDDIVVAAPQLTSSRGGLYLHLGSASGLNTTSTSLTQGLVSNSELGAALAGAGDVNGDGLADIVAGAPLWNSARGAVYVFHGGATGFGASPATAITSTTAGERWGTAVAGGGDVDGDGYPEIVAGAPFASSNAGRVALYPGGPTGVSTTAAWTLAGAAATETGRALVFIGDVGGDGRDDLAVGAPRTGSYTGAVFVFEGSATGLDTTATASLAGTAVGQQFGGGLGAGGDIDGDGYAELLVGAPGASTNTGQARVYRGAGDRDRDGILSDLDCDDDDAAVGLAPTWYRDGDGDGEGDPADTVDACTAPAGYAAVPLGPCDDGDPGTADAGGAAWRDGDGDGFGDAGARTWACRFTTPAGVVTVELAGWVADDTDCDDTDTAIRPGASEAVGDGVDQDCDGGDACFADGDGDGVRTAAVVASADLDCADAGEAAPAAPAGDCDDADLATYPGAPELPGDGKDQSCDGSEDCYSNADGDGFRTGALVVSADADCTDAGEALTTLPSGDCDDADAATYPGAPELPGDGKDQSCDGSEDCYSNADGDGFRTGALVVSADADCTDAGEALASLPAADCDDADAATYPGAPELPGDGKDQSCDGSEDCYSNADGDGFRTGALVVSADADCTDAGEALASLPAADCDDADAATYPGAPELPGDGKDQSCDGAEDCYSNADGDGFRTGALVVSADADCADAGEALAARPSGDCDDADAATHPGAPELPGDGKDQSCDGSEDCYSNADGDGFRTGALVVSADADCADAGEALATLPAADCDDTDPATFPGAPELPGDHTDQSCDGAELCFVDADADGWRLDDAVTVLSPDTDCFGPGEAAASTPTLDCDDADAEIHPAAAERPGDAVDQDCDGTEACYVDDDGDGHRPDATSTLLSADIDCGGPGEATAAAPLGDCDDTDPTISPVAAERAGDAVDQDCDGAELCFVDADGDGHRPDATSTLLSADIDCGGPGEASAAAPLGDCDDADPAISPVATEIPGDAVDQDCDGAEVCFADADGDGHRPGPTATVASADVDCSDAGEALATAPTTDCDDTDPAISPLAAERPGDGVDQDCDAAESCYVDADGDGHRRPDLATVRATDLSCTSAGLAPASAPAADCDDADPATHPGAFERPGDGVDQSCDGAETCYVDGDGDGVRPDATATVSSADAACTGPGEAADTAPVNDCDDGDAAIFPGATERPGDGVDQDCDATELCYADADADGFRTGLTRAGGRLACDGPGEAPAARPDGDCDDADPAAFPGAPELPGDEVDQSCDGAETCFADADGDGVRPDPTATLASADAACDGPGEANAAAPVGDCADDDPTIFPGAVEAPGDEVDQDCDRAELCYVDADADGFRPDATTTVASADLRCTGPGEARALTPAGDCADDDPTRFPLAADAPGDEIDQNCDGTEICFVDADGDGVRPDAESLRLSLDADCADPGEAPASAPFGDCADADPAAFPGAAEAPGDGIDQDCDGAELCFVDADGDGAPAPDATPQPGPLDCAAPGLRPAGQAPDCDDADPTVFPGAPEAPRDGIDQDCDGRDLVPEKPSLRLTCAAAAPAPAAGLALLALGLATLRRRRR
jgi:MYXO-CTERM domain-containing protein